MLYSLARRQKTGFFRAGQDEFRGRDQARQEGIMRSDEKLPAGLQDALNRGLLKRLPLTFLPFVNQQLREWDYLFPNERQSVERLLLYVASLNPEQSTALFRDVVNLEEKMGVRHWDYSTAEQTIQNSLCLPAHPTSRNGARRCRLSSTLLTALPLAMEPLSSRQID